MFKEIVVPAGMLSALTIGAGFFSLPYLFQQSGFLVGLAYLAAFAIVLGIINWMYSEVIERTEGDHRFLGYAKLYLGGIGSRLSFFTTLIGIVLSLLIYLVLSAKFINIFLDFASFPHSDFLPALIFLGAAAGPIFWKVRKVADLGFGLTLGKVALILAIFAFGVKNISFHALTEIKVEGFLLPYAAVLFSLYGRSAISSIHSYFKANYLDLNQLGRAVFTGTLIPAILYALFVIGVWGGSTSGVSVDAVSGLTAFPLLSLLGSGLGLISIWAAYIFLSFELTGILEADLKFKSLTAHLMTLGLPIGLYLSGFTSLIDLIGVAGGVFISVESVMVIMMWSKVRYKKIRLWSWSSFLYPVFLLGAAYEIRHALF